MRCYNWREMVNWMVATLFTLVATVLLFVQVSKRGKRSRPRLVLQSSVVFCIHSGNSFWYFRIEIIFILTILPQLGVQFVRHARMHVYKCCGFVLRFGSQVWGFYIIHVPFVGVVFFPDIFECRYPCNIDWLISALSPACIYPHGYMSAIGNHSSNKHRGPAAIPCPNWRWKMHGVASCTLLKTDWLTPYTPHDWSTFINHWNIIVNQPINHW